MLGVELRYLANMTAGTITVLLVFAIPFGIGTAAHLHHLRHIAANVAQPALRKPNDARIMPVAVSAAVLSVIGYVLFGEVESERAGASVAPYLWIAYSGVLIYSAVALARDVRSKLLGVLFAFGADV